jgi:radical SAM superfamily enzyme YgiQ (UPF0313 family)
VVVAGAPPHGAQPDDRYSWYATLALTAGSYNWAALVTNDFFNKQENLTLAKESGCELLFSGVESFDSNWLRTFNKLQNTSTPQVELISRCLNAGIIFCYGLMLDISSRTIARALSMSRAGCSTTLM